MTTPSTDGVRAGASTVAASAVVRALGVAREVAFAWAFGASPAADAWQVATRVPNALRDLVAEGTMANAFIPALVREDQRAGADSARRLAEAWLGWLLAGLLLVAVGMWLGSGVIADVVASGYPPEKRALIADLVAVLSPLLALVAVWALHASLLQLRGRFFASLASFGAVNVAITVAALAVGAWPSLGIRPIVAVAAAMVAGTAAAALIARWDLGDSAPRPRLAGHPALGALVGRVLPAALTVGAVQAGILLDAWIGAHLGDGPLARLGYAFRLAQMPMTLFAGSIAVSSLPGIASDAARGDLGAARDRAAEAVGFTIWLLVPCAVGLFSASDAVVALVYQHGAFGADDTARTAVCLQAYAVGLLAFGLHRVLVPASWGFGLDRAPLACAALGLLAKVPLAWGLSAAFGEVGLALSQSVAFTLEVAALAAWMVLSVGTFARWREIGASIAGGCAMLLVVRLVPWAWPALAVGVGAYLAVAHGLGAPWLLRLLDPPPGLPPHVDRATREALARHDGAVLIAILERKGVVSAETSCGTLRIRAVRGQVVADTSRTGDRRPGDLSIRARLDTSRRPPPLIGVRIGTSGWVADGERMIRSTDDRGWIEVK